MAQQPQPQYEFHYQRVELLKTESLGVGSYGAIYKAMCDDLPCAAKILHPALFQFTAPGSTNVMRKFEQECHLLSAIKHPHIVQYLGTHHDPESKLPVLLMELMDESLTQFLKRSRKPLPYHTEVNLCHDIALALSYLHSNGIVHRDLSSNNVLLIAGSRAKVTDFGMVKLYNVNRSTALTPLTLCPGTLVYMSPEALGEPPVYTDKLDSFSLGVLCVQIMTQQFPDPGDRFKVIEINDPRAPSGRVKVDVPEIERRRSHINLIDQAHPLLPVALECLKDRDRERPSCHELCGCISRLKASPKYTESVQQSQLNTRPTQSGNRESREREIQQPQQIQDLQQQLHTLSVQLHLQEQETYQQQQQILRQRHLLTATNGQLQKLQQQLITRDKQLAAKEEELADKDLQLQQKEVANQQVIQQLRQQLEKVTVEFQKHLLEREDEKRQLQQQSKQRDQRREEVEASGAAASGGSINCKVGWKDNPDDVKEGGGEGWLSRKAKMVAVPMQKPHLHEAVPENFEKGVATSMEKPHFYKVVERSRSPKEQAMPGKTPGPDQTPPAVPPKPQARGEYPGVAVGSSTGAQATEDIVIVPVDRHPGQEREESQYIPSSEIKHLMSVGGEEYGLLPKFIKKFKKKVSYGEDDALGTSQLDLTAESSTKGREQLDQEQANKADIPMKEVKASAFKLVHIDESARKRSVEIERRPHLYETF